MKKIDAYIVLDNVRSAENVGSIFRTADALGIKKIFLVGITPAPIDRFGRSRGKIAKVALGAEKSIAWEQRENLLQLLQDFKNSGVSVVAIEQDRRAQDYKEFSVEGDTAFIVGPEVEGLHESTLDQCDAIVEISMRGEKESLNVSVAVGVALSRILNL